MTIKKIIIIASSTLALGMVASGVAYAQMEEVIVTATKREQTLQEIPISVSVTSGDTIEKAQILDIADLQSVVPSLRVEQEQNSQQSSFIIRGFGNGADNTGIEPSVGVFIDGVYRSRSVAQIADLPKLERIEVLRGPQSTLFGKNASAGVISVTTAKPSYDTQGYVDVGLGNYSQRLIRGYVSGGVSKNIAVSVSGSWNKRDGNSDSFLGFDNTNNRDRRQVGGQVLFEPSDNVSIRLIADYSELDELCCSVTNQTNGPTADVIELLGGRVADDNNPFAYVTFQNADSLNLIEDGGTSLHTDVDYDAFTFTSISSFRSNQASFDYDADFSTLNLLDAVTNNQDIKTFTEEVRFTSVGEKKVDWMLGGYFFSEDIEQVSGLAYGDDLRPYFDTLLFAQTGDPSTLAGLEMLFGAPGESFFSGDTNIAETFTQDNTAYSLFGTIDWHVSERLTATFGLNYTRDKKTVTGNTVNGDVFSNIDLFTDLTVFGITAPEVLFGQTFFAQTGLLPTAANIALIESLFPGTVTAIQGAVNTGLTGLQDLQFQPQFLAFGNGVESGKSNDDKVTWTMRLAYEINDDINVYASAGTGFKSTSWNLSRDSRPFASDEAALVAANLTQVNQSFGTRFARPEETTLFEIGLKSRFSKGSVNIAIFDQTIEGFQSNTFIGTGFVLANAGKQSTRGLEFDGIYLPIPPLALTLGATFLDPKYDEFLNAPGPNGTVVDRSGETVAGVPEFALSTSATYTHEFSKGWVGFVRLDYQYESNTRITEIFDVYRQISVFNGSIGLDFENGWNIQLWGRNLLGAEYFTGAFPGVIQDGTINAFPSQPATYGVLLRKSF
ncbi:MAG: TonB-dependent receptor [Xanthomonadales bacterium]|nr:TonB-dependent receptor [Xanthomonadales bacterium]